MDKAAASKKILVCDDDETFAEVLEFLLVKEGYNVVKAHNGYECLEKLTEEKPDLLLVDLHMPNIDGFQLMEALVKDKALRPPPVMVISADQRKEDMELAAKLGARSFQTKPIDCEAMVAEVNKLLGRTNGPDANKPG